MNAAFFEYESDAFALYLLACGTWSCLAVLVMYANEQLLESGGGVFSPLGEVEGARAQATRCAHAGLCTACPGLTCPGNAGARRTVAQRDLWCSFVVDVNFARARKRLRVCVLKWGVENVHISYFSLDSD